MRVAIIGAGTPVGKRICATLTREGATLVAYDVIHPGEHVHRVIPLDLDQPETIARACRQPAGRFDAVVHCLAKRVADNDVVRRLHLCCLGPFAFLSAMRVNLAPGATLLNLVDADRGEPGTSSTLEDILGSSGEEAMAALLRRQTLTPDRAWQLGQQALHRSLMAMAGPLAGDATVNTVSVQDLSALQDGDHGSDKAVTPDSVAGFVSTLAHSRNRALSGSEIVLDGGASAGKRREF